MNRDFARQIKDLTFCLIDTIKHTFVSIHNQNRRNKKE